MRRHFHHFPIRLAIFIALPVNQAADRIHSQTVKMILLEPIVGRGLKKTGHLSARMDEMAAAPFALSNIFVRIFIKRRSVIFFSSVMIHRKMHRYKIHDRTDVGVVKPIDQFHQLCSRSVSGGRCIEPGILITPASVKRMFRQWHEFHMVVAVFLQIGYQVVGDFVV